jgi:hypothetical protein
VLLSTSVCVFPWKDFDLEGEGNHNGGYIHKSGELVLSSFSYFFFDQSTSLPRSHFISLPKLRDYLHMHLAENGQRYLTRYDIFKHKRKYQRGKTWRQGKAPAHRQGIGLVGQGKRMSELAHSMICIRKEISGIVLLPAGELTESVSQSVHSRVVCHVIITTITTIHELHSLFL